MNEPPRKEYVIRLLYTLLGRQQGVEYDKVFYTDKDDVEHEVKKGRALPLSSYDKSYK